jgi:hypothetical protein
MTIQPNDAKLEALELILNGCLELIENGDAQLDMIFDQFPDLTDVLRPPLEAASWLFLQRPRLDPLPSYKNQARTHLVKLIKKQCKLTQPFVDKPPGSQQLSILSSN